jgi:hypothetical protein
MKSIKVKPPRSKLHAWEAMELATRNLADDVYVKASFRKVMDALIPKERLEKTKKHK